MMRLGHLSKRSGASGSCQAIRWAFLAVLPAPVSVSRAETPVLGETPVEEETPAELPLANAELAVSDGGPDLLAQLLETLKSRCRNSDFVRMELKLHEPTRLFEVLLKAEDLADQMSFQAKLYGEKGENVRLTRMGKDLKDTVTKCFEANAHLKEACRNWERESIQRIFSTMETPNFTIGDIAELDSPKEETTPTPQEATGKEEKLLSEETPANAAPSDAALAGSS